MLTILLFAGVIAVLACLVALGYYLSGQRRKRLRDLAASLGFTFEERNNSLVGSIANFAVFGPGGHSRSARNILSMKKPPLHHTIFDYHYVVGSGDDRQSHTVTLAYGTCEGMHLPKFKLTPENLFHKIGGALGFTDINFPAFPEFSRRYRLVGSDEAAVRRVFGETVLRWFEQHAGISVEGERDEIAVYRQGRIVRPDDLIAFANHSRDVMRLFGDMARFRGSGRDG
jgi:hypothetical protein